MHPRHPARRALLAPAALLLVLTGCGGDEPSAAPSSAAPSSAAPSSAPAGDAPLSKADYVTAAEAVCTKAGTDGEAVPQPADPAGFAPYLQKTLDIAAGAVADLQALRPPAADAADLEAKFTGPLAQQVELFRPLVPLIAEAAKAPDPATALDQVPTPETPKADDAYLSAYGMPTCASFASSEG